MDGWLGTPKEKEAERLRREIKELEDSLRLGQNLPLLKIGLAYGRTCLSHPNPRLQPSQCTPSLGISLY